MAYDLLIKNGRVVDGSGMPAFRGDVAVTNGKIVAIGKLRDTASRIIDADGLVVAPGFIDNHCHYDAQVTWDPLCTFSCYHGATSVIIGNCSLALAPVRRGREDPPRRVSLVCGSDPHGGAEYRPDDLGNGGGIHGHPRQAARGQRGQSHRPFGRALLRHGRRVPGARRHAGRDRGHARYCPRGHAGRGAGAVGVEESGPLRSAGGPYSGVLGRGSRDLCARGRPERTGRRDHPERWRAGCGVGQPPDDPSGRGLWPSARL